MHHRLPAESTWICLIALPLGLAIAAGQTLEPAAAPSLEATQEPALGLLGHYYTRDLPGSYDLKGFLSDEYDIPVPNKQPNAIRVDAQIAFGKANRTRYPAPYPAEVTATFYARELNIGAVAWGETGKVERLVLQPGEKREVSVTWTPTEALGAAGGHPSYSVASEALARLIWLASRGMRVEGEGERSLFAKRDA